MNSSISMPVLESMLLERLMLLSPQGIAFGREGASFEIAKTAEMTARLSGCNCITWPTRLRYVGLAGEPSTLLEGDNAETSQPRDDIVKYFFMNLCYLSQL